jgi:flagellar hook-length control protein FliK
MTSTAVVQSANQIVGAVAGRSDQMGRKTGEAEEQFSGLLSKLSARVEEGVADGDGAAGEMPPTDGDPLKLLKWLAGTKTPAQDGSTEAVVAEVDGEQSAAKLLMVIAQATGMPVPLQTASTTMPTALPQPAGPGAAIDPRAMLPDDVPMEGEPPPEVKAVQAMAVLKRETHLGSGSAATESMNEWSASLLAAQGAGERQQIGPRPANLPGADATRAALADEQTARGLTQEAIAALRNTQPGGSQLGQQESRPNGPAMSVQTTEVAAAVADTVEQVTGGMRPELTGGGGSTVASAPVQVLAGRIAEEAATLSQPAPGAGSAAAHALSAVMTPTKVLQIQLQPVELGTVTMRLTLKDNALQVELEVGRGETKTLIQNDKDALTALLRSAGYLVDGLDVRMADPNSANMNGGGQANLQAQSGGSSQTDGHAPGARGQDDGRGHRHGHEGSGRNEQNAEAGNRAGVFV